MQGLFSIIVGHLPGLHPKVYVYGTTTTAATTNNLHITIEQAEFSESKLNSRIISISSNNSQHSAHTELHLKLNYYYAITKYWTMIWNRYHYLHSKSAEYLYCVFKTLINQHRYMLSSEDNHVIDATSPQPTVSDGWMTVNV